MDGFTLDLVAIRDWCDRHKVPYIYNSELNQLALPRQNDRRFAVRVIPRPERKMITLAMPLPLVVPKERFEAAQQAMAIANSATFMGSWVLNHVKGEAYFRVTVPSVDVLYNDDSLRYLLQVVIGTVEAVAEKLRLIVQEGAEPETVLPRPKPTEADAGEGEGRT